MKKIFDMASEMRLGARRIARLLLYLLHVRISATSLQEMSDKERPEKVRGDVICGMRFILGLSWSEYGPMLDGIFLDPEVLKAMAKRASTKSDKP